MGLSLGACRQADGPIPTPNQNVQGELEDVRHDLQNVASGRDPQAPKDLADDLRKYTEEPEAMVLRRRAAASTAIFLLRIERAAVAAEVKFAVDMVEVISV